MDFMNFVFQSFWHWLGTVILLAVLVTPLATFATTLAAVLGARSR